MKRTNRSLSKRLLLAAGIIVLVLAFNYLGDGLRDALDPKLK